ncbi:TerL, partial [Candidatus Magnetobacterium bavaricum]
DNMGLKQFIQNRLKPQLLKYRNIEIVGYGDPAGTQRSQNDERTCYNILSSEGLSIYPASTNANVARVGAVEDLLSRLVDGKAAFQLSPVCKVLRKGFNGAYQYKRLQVSQERYSDVPDKNEYSHIHDALQYAALYALEGVKKKTAPAIHVDAWGGLT